MFYGPHLNRGFAHAAIANLLANVIKKVRVPPALAPAVAPLPATLECTAATAICVSTGRVGWGATSDPKEYGEK